MAAVAEEHFMVGVHYLKSKGTASRSRARGSEYKNRSLHEGLRRNGKSAQRRHKQYQFSRTRPTTWDPNLCTEFAARREADIRPTVMKCSCPIVQSHKRRLERARRASE